MQDTTYTPRMEGLDALRGFALFGLFIVHMPELFELYWAHPATDPFQLAVHDAVWLVFAGKAFALLALCFGVSFFIIMDRAAKRGVDFTARFVWRLVLLAAMGLLHGLWYRGDVLEVLAVMGLFLLPFYRVRSNRVLLAVAVLFLLQPLMLVRIVAGLAGADWANQPLRFWSATIPQVYLDGGFVDTLRMNVAEGWAFKWLFMYESGRLSQILGLSLVGMLLGRIGFFSRPQEFVRARVIGLLIALGVAVALYFAREPLAAWVPASEAMPMPRALTGALLGSLFDLAVMAVLMLGFVALYYGGAHRALGVLAPAGRMTLTLYIAQSLLFVPVFYGYGLGLHASMTQVQALLLGLAAFAVQMLFAHLWFRRFYYGPLEWVWRAGTYLTVDVPFVKRGNGAPGKERVPA
ncbi:DUF418 domain-containing protein [Pseudoxanthomonas daejeonensis]|uniref:DUF418 domain-containing protein n=1 Tax=Pseudoxanthomonas daejeonensis TaxID=266062 RepID=UPI001F5445FB|nr:DUF418 domain-containing protein [Pseudoxanthomonas daejeonensis]UNK57764.1 DUF418 domain-containing protein [Pseudoxanthomonas daejeonensis]